MIQRGGLVRLLPATASILLVFVVGGCGISSPTRTVVVTATPTQVASTIPPTTTAVPTTALVSPGPYPTATRVSGLPGPVATPRSSLGVIGENRREVVRKGFQPSGRPAHTSDGFGHTLYAFRGICSGSGDGYCQKVFFFIDRRYLGTDTKGESMSIRGWTGTSPGTIAITYENYRRGDPNCCPSGKPVTITYHWNGYRLIPSGTPPGH